MAATTPIIPRVIRTSARVNAGLFLCEKWDVKRGKTVSGINELWVVSCEWFVSKKLLMITESLPSLFVRGSSRLRTLVSITNAGEGSITVSCWTGQLYFKLSPSLKFLNSYNSLRNFFSPSRGEILISFNVSSGGGQSLIYY